MSKKFKNIDWVVTSKNPLLLQAFENDLKEKGFHCNYKDNEEIYIIADQSKNSFAIVEGYAYERQKSFNLPEDYVKALEYCSQEEQKDIVFEDGKWYITENEQYLIRANGKTTSGRVYYYELYILHGQIFRYVNDWCAKEVSSKFPFKEATLKEVEKHLIRYAKQQGYFKEGVKTKGFFNDNLAAWKKENVHLFKNIANEYCLGNGIGMSLYIDGKWAEIVKDEEIFIDGGLREYKVEFASSHILINKITYPKHMVEAFYEAMKLGQIKSLNVGCNGQYKIDFEKIEKIYKKLTNGNN